MLNFSELKAGQVIAPNTNKAITKEQLKEYAIASQDLNPLHTDDAFAQKLGLPGVIAHGMLVMGQLGKYVTKLAGDKAQVGEFNMRFGAMTFPNDEISCSAVIESVEKGQAVLNVYATKGTDEVVGTGKAVLLFEEEAV